MVQVTVAELIDTLSQYPEDAKVLFVEHPYRGSGTLYRADDNDVLDVQRHYSYKPGLTDPEQIVVFNLTHMNMTTDYVPAGGGDSLPWPGKE